MSHDRPLRLILGGQIPERFFATRQSVAGFTPVSLRLDGGRITSVDQEIGLETVRSDPSLNAECCFILPGFMDIHIHGAAGHDTMDASPEGLRTLARFLVSHGVTSFLPTTLTAPHDAILNAVQSVAQTPADPPTNGARILGIHLEGPYISAQYPGAQAPDAIRPPNPAEFRAYLDAGPVRLVTLAPEVPGAEALIHEARRRGVAVALGHSAATYAQTVAAFDNGVSQTTHTFNAMSGLHHREPGAVGAALRDDRVYAQLIADGIHVHPAAMAILARCKGVAKTILISDAMAATGLGPGAYTLGGLPVTVERDECRLASGALAGSVLTLDVALRRFMAATGLPLSDAWVATSLAPATAMGLEQDFGFIAPGAVADLVLLDEGLNVVATVVDGRVVYLRDTERLILN
jgi:N-acetylglucosamine-6-phosphate deacetylase